MSYVLVIFDYLWFSWRMIVFAVLLLLEKMSLMVIQSFFVFVILLEFKLLKFFVVAVAAVVFLHVLKFLHIYSFVFCNFASLYLSERFMQFVAQFPLYWHSFSMAFCHERIDVISDLFLLIGSREQMRLALTEISQ